VVHRCVLASVATAGIIQELEKGEIKYSSIRQVLYVMKCPV